MKETRSTYTVSGVWTFRTGQDDRVQGGNIAAEHTPQFSFLHAIWMQHFHSKRIGGQRPRFIGTQHIDMAQLFLIYAHLCMICDVASSYCYRFVMPACYPYKRVGKGGCRVLGEIVNAKRKSA